MTNHRMDSEEEALFRSYPYALYFVQSPSSVSRATVVDDSSPTATAQRFTLAHYSSSRGSTNSFSHEKKVTSHYHAVLDEKFCNGGADEKGGGGDIDAVVVEEEDESEEEEEDYFGNRGGGGWWRRYFSFGESSSCVWISLQISLRVMVSLGIALLVFYVATKPPPPKVSLKIDGISEFELGEGVDSTGVTTKILNSNCSVKLLVNIKSKLFGLHIRPPILTMSFRNLPFVISRGTKLYAFSDGSTSFLLYVGTKNKPMYGAGRTMQDIVESGKGLPLVIHVTLSSSFHVIPKLIAPKFHHKAECLLILGTIYDKKHRTLLYNSRCNVL